MIAAAVLAPQLGLDSNQDWGPSRRLLVGAGILTVALAWLDRALWAGGHAATRVQQTVVVTRTAEAIRQILHTVGRAAGSRRILRAISETRIASAAFVAKSPYLAATVGNRRVRVLVAAWGAFLVAATSYAWYASVGMWFQGPGTTAYHDMQADAFLHGQAHLLIEPDPRLLALPNPYDPVARQAIPHIWDASLFEGRYYLYWGPVPALLIVPIKTLWSTTVRDNFLVFLFMTGAVFWCTRLLTRAWWDHYREVPGWVVVGSVLAIGWANPSPWLVSNPYIYESAIAGGQFFLLMGVGGLYSYLGSRQRQARNLLWAGISFALAVGTRASLAPGVVAVSVLPVYQILRGRSERGWDQRLLQLVAYLTPLVMTALALGIYNNGRFGSPLETGQYYQLTSFDPRDLDLFSMSPANIPPNLYNYLINPVRTLSVFPYIKANWGGIGSSILRIPVPDSYFTWQISGILIIAPFFLFALSAARAVLRHWANRRPGGAPRSLDPPWWVPGLPLVIGVAEFATIQFFVVASMRYQGDFAPSLLLAAAFGLWSAIIERARAGRAHAGTSILGLLLMSWTSVAGLLLGVTSVEARFENLNPALFDHLVRFFTP